MVSPVRIPLNVAFQKNVVFGTGEEMLIVVDAPPQIVSFFNTPSVKVGLGLTKILTTKGVLLQPKVVDNVVYVTVSLRLLKLTKESVIVFPLAAVLPMMSAFCGLDQDNVAPGKLDVNLMFIFSPLHIVSAEGVALTLAAGGLTVTTVLVAGPSQPNKEPFTE